MAHAESFGLSPAVPFGRPRVRSYFTDGRLLNFWMVAIVVIGLFVVVVDGLTKTYDYTMESTTEEVLSHKVTPGAAVFAAVMFPLVLLYARRARASSQEGILLWFMLCTMTYSKDFSYLQIPGIPIYVSDYVLAWLTFREFIWPRLRWFPLKRWPMPSVLLLVAVGMIAALRGLAGGQQAMIVFRDLAMVVYAMFLLVGMAMMRDARSIGRLLWMLCIGASLMSINAMAFLLTTPGLRRYILQNSAGQFVMMCLILMVVATMNRLVPALVGWGASVVMTIGVLLANARAINVALGGALVLLLVFGPSLQSRSLGARIKSIAYLGAMGIVVFVIAMRTSAGVALVERSSEEFVSGVVYSQTDDNAQFRLLAWAEAFSRFARNPIMGEGYGVPFTFANFDEDPRPHNTFLTFLYKTGVVGFLVIAVFIAKFFVRGAKSVWRYRGEPEATLLYGLLLGILSVYAAAMFGFVFESPHLASVMWISMAAAARMMSLLGAAHENHLGRAAA